MDESGVIDLGKLTPKSVALFSIRRSEVVLVEDLMKDNPDWKPNCGLPRRIPDGSMVVMKGGKVRTNASRAEVLAVIDPDGTEFGELVYRDPDGRDG